MRVSPGSDVSSALSIEQSVMISGHGKGRGRDRDFGGRGRGFVGGGRGLEVNRVPLRKAPDNVDTVNVAITSPKSTGRNFVNLNGNSYLILVLLPRGYSLEFFICYS